MAIVFEPGQEIELELPGGKYAGKIVEAIDVTEGLWAFKVEEKTASEQEVQQARRMLAAIKSEGAGNGTNGE